MGVQTLDHRPMHMRWEDWSNACLGAWLIIAPFLGLGHVNDSAAWNSYLVGTIVVLVAAAGIVRVRPWEEWTNLTAGVWLLLAPFFMHFTNQQSEMWNQVVVGGLIIVVSGSALYRLKGAYANT